MLIKSLRMENFRQFRGSTNIDFSCDPEKNVTVILGDNTYGKTTLLQAFNWCFYGKVNFDQNPDFLLNYEVSAEMRNGEQQLVEVEIMVLHDGIEYVITRSQRYTCSNGNVRGESVPTIKVSYKQNDGQTESVKAAHVEHVINNILPEDLSTYFFFDTERVSSVSSRRDVAEAVKGLLGLSIMDSAIKHLGDRAKKSTVIGKLYGSMDLDGDAKAQGALNRIQTAEEKSAVNAEQLDDCISQINQYDARKEQLDAILRDNQSTSVLQKKKEDLERRIATERKALASTISLYFQEFSEGALPFFAQPLLVTARAFLKEVKVDDKGIKDLTKDTILELIKRGRCVCGQPLVEGSEALKHLQEELAYVPPESIGNTVRHYREKLGSFSHPAKNNPQFKGEIAISQPVLDVLPQALGGFHAIECCHELPGMNRVFTFPIKHMRDLGFLQNSHSLGAGQRIFLNLRIQLYRVLGIPTFIDAILQPIQIPLFRFAFHRKIISEFFLSHDLASLSWPRSFSKRGKKSTSRIAP